MYTIVLIAENTNMKKTTKILLIIFILILIPTIILSRDVFLSLVPNENGFNFVSSPKSIAGLILIGLSMIFSIILYAKFLTRLSLNKLIFFSSVPIIIIYGFMLFLLAYLSNLNNEYANFIKKILNITEESGYNTILWAVLISIVFLIILYCNLVVICRPVNKIEHVISRLGDGKVKEDKLNIGGGKQFQTIEHSLIKINNNYKEKDNTLRNLNYLDKKILPKPIYKFLGRESVTILERDKKVKKVGVLASIKISNTSFNNITLEENFKIINAYMNSIAPLIKKSGGFIDKYIGEGIIAIFSKPDSAIDCSRNIIRVVRKKNNNKKNDNISVEIALHYGDFMLGVTDEEEKVPTIISNLNIINKIANITKYMKSSLVFSKSILDNLSLNYHIEYRCLGFFKEEDKDIYVYEDLSCYSKNMTFKLLKNKNIFEKGVMYYNNRDYDKSLLYFQEILKSLPEDNASYIYYNKTKEKLSLKS